MIQPPIIWDAPDNTSIQCCLHTFMLPLCSAVYPICRYSSKVFFLQEKNSQITVGFLFAVADTSLLIQPLNGLDMTTAG